MMVYRIINQFLIWLKTCTIILIQICTYKKFSNKRNGLPFVECFDIQIKEFTLGGQVQSPPREIRRSGNFSLKRSIVPLPVWHIALWLKVNVVQTLCSDICGMSNSKERRGADKPRWTCFIHYITSLSLQLHFFSQFLYSGATRIPKNVLVL